MAGKIGDYYQKNLERFMSSGDKSKDNAQGAKKSGNHKNAARQGAQTGEHNKDFSPSAAHHRSSGQKMPDMTAPFVNLRGNKPPGAPEAEFSHTPPDGGDKNTQSASKKHFGRSEQNAGNSKSAAPDSDKKKQSSAENSEKSTPFISDDGEIITDENDRYLPRRERERRRIEAYRQMTARRRAKTVRRTSTVLIVALIAAVIFCALVYKFIFVITTVQIEGSNTFSSDEILEASGVSQRDNLFSFSAKRAGENIMFCYPTVSSVKINRVAPNKVIFTITEGEASFFADIYGEYYALSSDLRVMGQLSAEKAANTALIKLKLPLVTSALAGKPVEFSQSSDSEFVSSITSAAMKSDIAERLTLIDMRSSQDLVMACDNKYKLSFGDSSELEIKLKLAAAVLKDELFQGENKAVIDLSDTSETGVVIDNNLTFD